ENIEKPEIKWAKCEEFLPEKDNIFAKKILGYCKVNTITLDNIDILYFDSKDILKILQDKQSLSETASLKAEQSHSDLLPTVYEGGLKIWECTFDLLNYLKNINLDLGNKDVLDLGCGSGIIGIYGLINNSFCYFQDYYTTYPNVLLNTQTKLDHCKFYAGDWQSFSELLETDNKGKFDFIFTSETIYNTDNYAKLHNVFEKLLKISGTMYPFSMFNFACTISRHIYLAAKSFYFGVGGGISLFQDFLEKKKVFKYSSCWKCDNGITRQILRIEFIT
ncbi:hypothetical protein NQ317_000858, partial [Molorchus minor]